MSIDAAELANLTRGIGGDDVLVLKLSDGRTVTIPAAPGDLSLLTLLLEAMLGHADLRAALVSLGVQVT